MTAHRPVPYRLRAGPYDLDAAGEKIDRMRVSQFAALGFVGARIVWSRELEAELANATPVVPATGPLRPMRPLQLLAKEDAVVELMSPDRRTLAAVERNAHGPWLSLKSLLEDGTIVRTVCSPNGSFEAQYRDLLELFGGARFGLAAWMAWANTPPLGAAFVDKPRVGLRQQWFPEGTVVGDLLAAHRRMLGEVGGHPVDLSEEAVSLTLHRRTLDVVLTQSERAEQQRQRFARVAMVLSVTFTAMASRDLTLDLQSAALLFLLVRVAAPTPWGFLLGGPPWALIVAVAVVAWFASSLSLWTAGVVTLVTAAMLWEAAVRATGMLLGGAWSAQITSRIQEPAQVPAAEMTTVYRQ
jgi:hypothetical protein